MAAQLARQDFSFSHPTFLSSYIITHKSKLKKIWGLKNHFLGSRLFGEMETPHHPDSQTNTLKTECEQLAREYGMTYEEFMNRCFYVGKEIAKKEACGARAVVIEKGHLLKVVFSNGNGNSANKS